MYLGITVISFLYLDRDRKGLARRSKENIFGKDEGKFRRKRQTKVDLFLRPFPLV